MVIIGVGFDTPTANAGWAAQESFAFELWTDGDRQLATYYDAVDTPGQVNPSRVTKVLDATGTLVLEYVDSIVVGEHPAGVLSDCTVLFGP